MSQSLKELDNKTDKTGKELDIVLGIAIWWLAFNGLHLNIVRATY